MQLVIDNQISEPFDVCVGDIIILEGTGNYMVVLFQGNIILLSLSGATYYSTYNSIDNLNIVLNRKRESGQVVKHYSHRDYSLKLEENSYVRGETCEA